MCGETCKHGSEGAGRWQHRPATRNYEGFEGANLSEYASFETVCELAEFIGEYGELAARIYQHYGNDLDPGESHHRHQL